METTVQRERVPVFSPSLVRWGGAFAGAVIALALFRTLSALWFGLIAGSQSGWVADHVDWFDAGSAIFCLFLAGAIAAWISARRGTAAGFMTGVTAWALMLLGTLAIGSFPSIFRVFAVSVAGTGGTAGVSSAWAPFIAFAGGLVAAGIGGWIGGALPGYAAPVDDVDLTSGAPSADRTVVRETTVRR